MADPVGVAGTAVGVVSLGLQVYGGLKQYLGDFNSRDERVAKTLAYLEQLKEALGVINIATQSLHAQHQVPADTVLSCLRSCLAEMQALETKLQQFGPSQHINLKGKMKEIKKKLEYPFQISVLEEIGKNLERITNQLSLAINGLELHSHLTVSTNVDILSNAIGYQTDILTRIKLDSDNNQKINHSNSTQLTSINLSVQPLMPMLEALESVTEVRFDKFENQTHLNHSATTTRLDVLESRTEANTQVMAEMLNILRHANNQPLPMNQDHMRKYLVGALVSKPSLLGDVHKSYGFQQEGYGLSTESTSSTQTLWMYFMAQRGREKYTLRTFGVTYSGLGRLLSAAVSVSLCLDYGAGGTSISPTFRYYHVVDQLQSPPFRKVLELGREHSVPVGTYTIRPWCDSIAAGFVVAYAFVPENRLDER
ncbi:hypothetical protein E0Z10_g6674 [Xylaria hypoxylon]|uniref:Fungal N-terminal domain-containing protein n=1 Tax=Xylaria hypoxylon TaxID=37992 RepID=A0A4Z0YPY8_9PEZI|nr:hypothetical protein E0Z10_g6674 [Xylaria hypoxylon]